MRRTLARLTPMATLTSRVRLSWTTLAKRDIEVYRRSRYRVVLQLVRMNAESLDESPTVGMGVGKEEEKEGEGELGEEEVWILKLCFGILKLCFGI
ncbi:hypothetical protein COP1_020123 [Malus domestica]